MDVDKLITENLSLIKLMIKKLNCQWKSDDEWQEYYDSGLEGLIKGAKTYDETKGAPSTYLCRCIKNQIMRCFCLKKMQKRYNPAGSDLSLNQCIDDDEKSEFGDLIPDANVDIEKEIEQKLEYERVLNVINNLKNEKDKIALKMYYGLDGYQELGSCQAVGEKLGVTREMIRIRLERAKKKIRAYLEKNDRDVSIKKKNKMIYGSWEDTILMDEYFKKEESANEITYIPQGQTNILDEINTALLENLQRLRNLDTKNKTKSAIEIARSNAISTTSKTILQTIGVQMMAHKSEYNLPMIEKK